MNDAEFSRLESLATYSHQGLNAKVLPFQKEDRILMLGRQCDGGWIGFALVEGQIVFFEFPWESNQEPTLTRFEKINPEDSYSPDWLPSGFVCIKYTDFDFAREMLRIFGNNFMDALWDITFSQKDEDFLVEIFKKVLDRVSS